MCQWFHNDNVFRQFYIFKALWGRVTFQTAIVVIKGMSFQLFTLRKHKLYTNRQIRWNFCLPLSDGMDIISPTSKHPRIRKVIKVIKKIITYIYVYNYFKQISLFLEADKTSVQYFQSITSPMHCTIFFLFVLFFSFEYLLIIMNF